MIEAIYCLDAFSFHSNPRPVFEENSSGTVCELENKSMTCGGPSLDENRDNIVNIVLILEVTVAADCLAFEEVLSSSVQKGSGIFLFLLNGSLRHRDTWRFLICDDEAGLSGLVDILSHYRFLVQELSLGGGFHIA